MSDSTRKKQPGPARSSPTNSSGHYHYSTFANDLETQDLRRAALQASADQFKEEREKGAFAREVHQGVTELHPVYCNTVLKQYG